MKRSIHSLITAAYAAWRRQPKLRWLVCTALPLLALSLMLGGIRSLMLAAGYVQLVYLALLPGEMVETGLRQRQILFCSGLSRMLFFTALMAHAAWPLFGLAAALALCMLLYGSMEESAELSPLPLLSASAFAAPGMILGTQFPAAQFALACALALTFVRLLAQRGQTVQQLKMRLHLA